MASKRLFQVIAESIRDDIYAGRLKPGDELATVRHLAAQYHCAPGTILRAYQELADAGLISSQIGQGTRVANVEMFDRDNHLMKLKLVNRVEAFVLDLMGMGYSATDIESAIRLALDGIAGHSKPSNSPKILRFVGSHDPALSMTSSDLAPNYPIEMRFSGSMNGLLELARGRADFSGCHLYDSETHSYNIPFIRRLFSGRKVAVLTLVNRVLGLIVAPDNHLDIHTLHDLVRPDVRFVNRQSGAGTRLWLDSQLAALELQTAHIQGYERIVNTHSELAKLVASDEANVGIGVEAAAQMYGLGFIPLTTEQYDLIIPVECWENPTMQVFVASLYSDATRQAIEALGGYDTSNTGKLNWVS